MEKVLDIVRFRKDARYASGCQINTRLNITQKEKSVLEKFREIFGCGKFHFHKRDKLWYLDVWRIKEQTDVIKQILPYLIVKKEKAERFLEVLHVMSKKEHLSVEGVKRVRLLWEPQN